MIRGYDLDYIEAKLQYWNSMRCTYDKLENNRIISQNTKQLLEQICNITPENSIVTHLYSDTKTVPIIDKFCKSNKLFLIFEDQFSLRAEGHLLLLSPIISKVSNKIFMRASELTATNIKQFDDMLQVNDLERYADTRYFPLISSIFQLDLINIDNDASVSFLEPCQFNAQNSSNRKDYGNVYHGDYMAQEGTLYGETTTFAIIGVKVAIIV